MFGLPDVYFGRIGCSDEKIAIGAQGSNLRGPRIRSSKGALPRPGSPMGYFGAIDFSLISIAILLTLEWPDPLRPRGFSGGLAKATDAS